MPEPRQHTLEFTPEEYQRFRAVLKTQVILKQERVFGFFIDDMVLDDRGDVLRFKLAYMPPMLRKLDVFVSQTDSKVALSWNTPSLPWWDTLATVLSAVAISIFMFTRPALRNDVTIESMVFIALLIVWGRIPLFPAQTSPDRGRGTLREGDGKHIQQSSLRNSTG